ncbi:hypothetical protein TOI97_00565 [Denitrificimonas sp. JX-1]|uniref:Uncharacterized protein n=2 Tax=Denitrificimonas halotolerans TaxID=3098930 RepID=A0ABU5GME1_9GAMM|nr:hypothetical protein [Denitrificimonas sp. JX-1]
MLLIFADDSFSSVATLDTTTVLASSTSDPLSPSIETAEEEMQR